MFKNELLGIYEISRETEGLIVLNKKNEETGEFEEFAEFPYDFTKDSVKDVYVTMFVHLGDDCGSMSGKYVQYTDINGITSEIVLDDDALINKLEEANELLLDQHYLFVNIRNTKDQTEIPAYIKI